MKIFEFEDYKAFVKHFMAQQPRKGRGLVKALGEHLRCDPSQVSQVLAGSKEFSEEQALQVALFIGLNELETDYFLTLVKIERAGSKTLKDHYKKKLAELKLHSLDLKKRVNQDRILSDYEKSVFYSSYLYSAIRLATSVGDGPTVSDIAERFGLPREKVAGHLRFLTECGLCEERDGRYRMGTQHTHVERGSPFLSRHHHNWRIKSLERTESITEEELQFTGPFSINPEDFRRVREFLVEVISKSLGTVKESEPTDVACLLIDWFWLKK